MASWTSPIPSPTTQAPADELTAVLHTLQDRLRTLMSADRVVRPDGTGSCLEELYTAHLHREERTLPPRLRRLPVAEAERVVDTARRTARAAADAPRRDLLPAGL